MRGPHAHARLRTGLRAVAVLVTLLALSPLTGQLPTLDGLGRALVSERADIYVPPRRDLSALLTRAERLAGTMEAGARTLQAFHDEYVEPLAEVLIARTPVDSARADEIALALTREGLGVGLDPRLLLAVMLVENPWLDPLAESPVGAVGLMQVMPFHAGAWDCPGDDLTDTDLNICHGAQILASALERSKGDLDVALLRYNGCVRGVNTPDCHSYPSWVYREAGPEWAADIIDGIRTS